MSATAARHTLPLPPLPIAISCIDVTHFHRRPVPHSVRFYEPGPLTFIPAAFLVKSTAVRRLTPAGLEELLAAAAGRPLPPPPPPCRRPTAGDADRSSEPSRVHSGGRGAVSCGAECIAAGAGNTRGGGGYRVRGAERILQSEQSRSGCQLPLKAGIISPVSRTNNIALSPVRNADRCYIPVQHSVTALRYT